MSDLVSRDHARVWHPYTQMKTAPPPIAIARGEGVYLHTTDGRKILDAIASWWVNIHGHAHPHVAAAVARQAATLEQVIFAGFTHEPAVTLAERLVDLLPPGLNRIFYSDNGSTAVEVALKMAYQYWWNRGQERRTFIALHGAYHGDTFGAMAASDESPFTRPFQPLLFRVLRADAPYAYRCARCSGTCTSACVASLRALLAENEGDVAAVIVEPMLQGAGGMIVSPPEFLQEVRRACDESGTLLIADEVLTGFGRTGRMFACEHAGISPDLLCLSKALTAGFLPMGVTAATDEIYDAFLSDDRAKTFFHGHSYTANPLACAAANASLDLFEDGSLLQRVVRLGDQMRNRIDSLRTYRHVGEVRQIGGVLAVELVESKETRSAGGYLDRVGPELYARFIERGVLLRPLGNVVYLMPPYVISDDETDWVLDEIETVLRDWRWPA